MNGLKHPGVTSDRGTVLDALVAAVGPKAMLVEPSDTAAYVTDWRGLHRGLALCVLRPDNAAAVAAAVRVCAAAGIAVVPQGGNTSMVAGATPDGSGCQVVLSLARMNRIRAVDNLEMSITVEAGVVVRQAQLAANEAGCVFPLSFSADGSATVGGALATNAGGNNTVRYGNTRDLMLGLEVVLPDGRIWNGLRALRKDNAGYALSHLLVGSEGTLGIITAAVMKLVTAPRSEELALCAVRDEASALALYRRFRDSDEPSVRAFEYMSGAGVDLVLKHIEGAVLPLPTRSDHYVVVDLASNRAGSSLRELAETVLSESLEAGEVLDAVIAESLTQRHDIWRLREEHSEAQKREGVSIKNDVSVPISRAPELIRLASEAVTRMMPGIRPMPFGHMGDGNIHMNFVKPESMAASEFLAGSHELINRVNEIVRGLDGSFAAEHGIGRLKVDMLAQWRCGVELDLLSALKTAFDPKGVLNPGKVLLPASDQHQG